MLITGICGIRIRPLAVVAAAVIPSAQAYAVSESVLWSFSGGNDGAKPYAGLTPYPSPNAPQSLVGATSAGGANGQGVVYQIPLTGGTPSILYTFSGTGDGASPTGQLAVDTGGNILGTTTWASLNSSGTGPGYGGVFELVSANGAFTFSSLHTFASSDGANPYAGLVPDTTSGSANFYGTASAGGTHGSGAIFKVTNLNGAYSCCTTLYDFQGGSADGSNPYGGVSYFNSTLYGTTTIGGSNYNEGTIYSVPSSGGSDTILYAFQGNSNGAYPRGQVYVNSGGLIFGTASLYGSNSYFGNGTIFDCLPGLRNCFATLHAFPATGTDGAEPWSGLAHDSLNNLYGTTTRGGQYGYGTVYKLAYNSGNYTYSTLYSFTGGSDGANPYAALYVDTNGNIYGTTVNGGANGKGTVFKISP